MRAMLLLCSLLFLACPKPKDPTTTQQPASSSQPDNNKAEPDAAPPPTEKEATTQATPTPSDTPAETKPEVKPAEAKAPIPTETYVACGCGCCGGSEPRTEVCLYRSKGESLEKIKESDRKSSQRPQCAAMGCSLGTKYKYCD